LRAAQSAGYLIYSEADFEDFRPAGATRCTDGGEIWHGGYLAKMWNINAPQGRIPYAIFTKFAEFVPCFRMR